VHIISASRRTDIPAFYMPWFMNRIRACFAQDPSPFGGPLQQVSLAPHDVHSIVFWSKDYAPLLPHLDELEARGYHCCFHYTITGAPSLLEPNVPPWEQSVAVFRRLARRTSPRHVLWRFDPLLFTAELDSAHHLERFRRIAAALEGATERCYFSFAAFYGKVRGRLARAGIGALDPPPEEKLAVVEQMADVAESVGMALYACCQDALVGGRVKKAHCIDGDLLAELFPERPHVAQVQPTRAECGCFASRDIGMYDTCPHACLYCYANSQHTRAAARYRAHDPQATTLCPV
jgi:hypothetical protein